MKTRFAALAAALLCGGLLAGCGGAGSTPAQQETAPVQETVNLRVSFYFQEETRINSWLSALDGFAGQGADFTVTPYYGEERGWAEWTTAALPSGSAGDVVQLDGSWAVLYADWLMDLNQYSELLGLDRYPQEALDACTVDGRLTAVPLSLGGRVWLWDAEVWQAAGLDIPQTADDLLAAGRVFRERFGEKVYPLSLTAVERMELVICWLQSVYGQPFAENGTVNCTAGQLAEGLAFLRQLEEAHVIADYPALETAEPDSLTAAGRWVLETDLVCYEESVWQAGPCLQFGEAALGGSTRVLLALGIPAVSPHPDEAAQVLAWLTNGDGAALLGGACGVPVLPAGDFSGSARLLAAHETAAGFADFPWEPRLLHPDLTGTGGTFEQLLSGIDYGEYSLPEAAEWLLTDIQRAIGGA